MTFGFLALLLWFAILLHPAQAYRTRERLDSSGETADLADVTVLVPARNEAQVIGSTLEALAAQGPGLEIVVIDDASADGTGEIAAGAFREARAARGGAGASCTMNLIQGAPLPKGWGGKLWALEQGLAGVERRYTLLLDADIVLAPGMVAALLAKIRTSDARLVSIMARLRCESFLERLLVPPFIFFFKLLYPFSRVNDPARRAAAAAGGCMLVETAVLREVGAFESLRGELIDDCALARRVKGAGHGVFIALSRSVESTRGYRTLGEFWQMVSRTAFTQLRFSTALLLAVTVIMLAAFPAPVAAAVVRPSPVTLAALAAMAAAFYPVVRFYRLSPLWICTFPAAAGLYLLMTWTSAWSYWRGTQATWKNRTYDAQARS